MYKSFIDLFEAFYVLLVVLLRNNIGFLNLQSEVDFAEQMRRESGQDSDPMGALLFGLLLALFLAFGVIFLRRVFMKAGAPNKVKVEISTKDLVNSTSPSSVPESDTTALELSRYKKMLDDGLISQEDYDAKKKEILGL